MKKARIRLQLNKLKDIVNNIANKDIINFIEAFSTQKAQKHVADDQTYNFKQRLKKEVITWCKNQITIFCFSSHPTH